MDPISIILGIILTVWFFTMLILFLLDISRMD